MMLLAFFLIGVIGGLTAALYATQAWNAYKVRVAWDADTGEALALVNDAADEDDDFDAWMQQRWADR